MKKYSQIYKNKQNLPHLFAALLDPERNLPGNCVFFSAYNPFTTMIWGKVILAFLFLLLGVFGIFKNFYAVEKVFQENATNLELFNVIALPLWILLAIYFVAKTYKKAQQSKKIDRLVAEKKWRFGTFFFNDHLLIAYDDDSAALIALPSVIHIEEIKEYYATTYYMYAVHFTLDTGEPSQATIPYDCQVEAVTYLKKLTGLKEPYMVSH